MRTWIVAAVVLAGCTPPPAPFAAGRDAAGVDGRSGPVGGPSGGPSSGGSGGTTECDARVLVVFDRSGSMASPWEDGAPRWRVAADALDAAIAPLADRLTVGAILFPSSEPSSTGVCAPVDPVDAQLPYTDGPSFLDAWRARWESAELLGDTPLDTAFDAADASLPDDAVVTAVVLLTDGEPTCRGPVAASTHAEAWAARGIRTFVIGLPGVSGAATLDAIAAAGQTGSPISPSDASALTADLRSFLGDVLDQACAE